MITRVEDSLFPECPPSPGRCQHRAWLVRSDNGLYRWFVTIHLRPGGIDDEQSLLGLFDEAVLWLTERGLSGQWGSQLWSERPDRRERVASLAGSPGTTVAQFENEVVGALEVNEVSPSYAPVTKEPGLYVDLLLTSRQFIGKGIGTALLDHARADCLARGLTLLRVDCGRRSPTACEVLRIRRIHCNRVVPSQRLARAASSSASRWLRVVKGAPQRRICTNDLTRRCAPGIGLGRSRDRHRSGKWSMGQPVARPPHKGRPRAQ
jgi:GNAT superfamily N-acetyltransferase